jgi:FkbM family methyltransferase
MQLLRKIEKLIKTPILQYIKYKELKKYNYIVKFLYEGGVEIKVPNLSISEVLLSYGIIIKRNLYMMGRPYIEILLRNIIYELYKDEYINKNFSIIDIGSWIGDNGLVWAHNLTGDAKVFCIEPSKNNLTYSKKCAQINNINNIVWLNKVCSENIGEELTIDGKTENSSDNHKYKFENSENSLSSTTLDEIISEKKIQR